MNGIIKAIWDYNRESGKNEVIGFENLHNYGYIEYIDDNGTRGTINGCLNYIKPKFDKMVKSHNYCYCVLHQSRTIKTTRYEAHDTIVIAYI